MVKAIMRLGILSALRHKELNILGPVHAFSKGLNPLSEITHQFGDSAAPTKQQDRDHAHDDDMPCTQAAHLCAPFRAVMGSRTIRLRPD